jgi:hypothetical protein
MTPLDVDGRLGHDAGQRAAQLGPSGDAARSFACRPSLIPLMNRPRMRPVSTWLADGETWVQQMTRSERNNHEED